MVGSASSAWALFLLLQGAVLGWMPVDPGAGPKDLHLGLLCESCHLAGRDVTPENAGELTTTQEGMCGRCHRGGIEASHPSGFVPERPLPEAFPLDGNGQMTCSTCHDVHETAPGRLRSAENGSAFCLSCHPGRFFESMGDAGLSLMASGHLDARTQPMSSIDPYTMQCIQCHEDRISPPGDGMRGAFGAFNHPVGATVGLTMVGRWGSGRSGGTVLLPGGRVSCVSCHRAYSREHGALVETEPELCFKCHDK